MGRRLDPDSPSERKRTSVEEAETEQGSKIQRVSALTHPELADQRMMHYDFRISAVTTKDLLEVPVVVNQDESELLLMKTLENSYSWYDTEFERDLEISGVDQLTQEQLDNAISTKWVKTLKPDGSGFDQKVDDLDDMFASTPSLVTLKLLLTLAAAFNWTVTCGDISTAFLHALISGEDIRVVPPPKFYPEGNAIWKLKRALYRLRNAPRLWQDHFASVMEKNNFKRIQGDPNLWVAQAQATLCLVLR